MRRINFEPLTMMKLAEPRDLPHLATVTTTRKRRKEEEEEVEDDELDDDEVEGDNAEGRGYASVGSLRKKNALLNGRTSKRPSLQS